jgi:hypothetical protein
LQSVSKAMSTDWITSQLCCTEQSPVGDCQARCPDQTSECMDVKLMQGKLFGAQVLESYNTEVSCGQGIKVLSFQGVVEPVRLEDGLVKVYKAGAPF